ncbi:Dabb family protein [Cohnella ginsengisoli]|uniref:Dabb family protein n=1 Tax=Cohnella ginsengisoli TaxID=425004 RepID=A0A9X4KH04_9BACL|nr:Dabb family protein [Cohnella ginsengisoli]MDG0792023.1 Dabb family protein [Cohnella ginsengisoli]
MSKPNHSAIRHQVIFDLKHEKGSAEADRFLKDGWRILTSIPAVRNFEVLKQVSPKNDYTYGYSMEFASQADYDSYNAHPAHVAFVAERWESEVTRFLEIDFVRDYGAEEGQSDAN